MNRRPSRPSRCFVRSCPQAEPLWQTPKPGDRLIDIRSRPRLDLTRIEAIRKRKMLKDEYPDKEFFIYGHSNRYGVYARDSDAG